MHSFLEESNAHEPMDFTGERMVPEKTGADTFWEHVERYHFAAKMVGDKRVLDIACGEGYGSAALLKAGASSVIGVDVSPEACDHARSKYGIDARVGDALNIPLPDGSIDMIVSFETIEHVPDPERFLQECLRVLTAAGTLIISTPNRDAYESIGAHENPYHCSELSEFEFTRMLSGKFESWQLYIQRPVASPLWSINSFSQEHSPWEKLRGFRRLRRVMTAKFCSQIQAEPTEKHRLHIVDEILSPDKPLSLLLNKYMVRKRSLRSNEQGLYIVAVARKQS